MGSYEKDQCFVSEKLPVCIYYINEYCIVLQKLMCHFSILFCFDLFLYRLL